MGIHHEDLQELTRKEIEREPLPQGLLQGLRSSTPKCIPISLLYDAKGTLLYERLLDEVPSYYPYAAEDELLRLHSASIASSIPPQCRLVELGCGDATKTVHLLNGVKALHGRCKYVGIDISGTAIKMAQENIMDQVKGMDESNLTFIEDDYRQGMRKAKAMFPDECFCIMWMGGSIGNFDRDAAIDFLLEALDVVGPNCLFFLCTDLWKEEEILYKAYHDDEGITELFIKNGMRNALSLLGYEATEEEHNSWEYKVVINKELRRVEMWVIFCDDITIERYDVHLRKGEGVLVEFSRKFSIRDIEELASRSNFYIQEAWRNKTYSCQMLYSAQEALSSCWSDTDAMFDGIKDWSARPIDLRHPFLFYYGHVAAFASSRLHLPPTNPYSDFDTMFSRGIDPNVLDPTICHDHPELPPQWPSRESIVTYVKSVRSSIVEALDKGDLPMYRVCLFLEHERMHLETLAYMLAQQTKDEFGREYRDKYGNNGRRCVKPRKEVVCNGTYGDDDDNVLTNGKGISDDATNVFIPPGKVVMGSEPSDVVFMWDNEMPSVERHVPDAFVVRSKPVSIREFMAFVEDGGYDKRENWARPDDFAYFAKNEYKWPATWSKVGGGEFYVHGVNTTKHWEEIGEDAVYVSLAEAEAYCKWVGGGMRIMSEEEYHKALEEEEEEEEKEENGKRVMDLRRGGWEWTCSPFQGFEGFEAMKEYEEYSVDFFDGNHFVLKGSSPVTHASLVRDSFRNFYQRQYRYMFAKFRCCRHATTESTPAN